MTLPQSLLLLLFSVAPSVALPPEWEPIGQSVLHQQSSSTGSDPGRRGAVASESRVCSEIGINLLAQGVSGFPVFL